MSAVTYSIHNLVLVKVLDSMIYDRPGPHATPLTSDQAALKEF